MEQFEGCVRILKGKTVKLKLPFCGLAALTYIEPLDGRAEAELFQGLEAQWAADRSLVS